MEPEYKDLSELDLTIKNLVIKDWHAFVALVGEDAITRAKICILTERGKTLGQITNSLNVTKNTVRWARGNNCPCK